VADPTGDWNQVSDSLKGLAQKLKAHLEQAGGEQGAARQDVKDDVQAALGKLGEAVEDAFDAMRNAMADPAVKDDVRQVGSSLRDALASTMAEVSEDLRESFERRRGGGG
jgi:hypothetical protein